MKTSIIRIMLFALACGCMCSLAQAGVVTQVGEVTGRQVVKKLGETALKKSAASVTRKMAKSELILLIGEQPVKRMSKLLNMRDLSAAEDLVAHNPSKEKIWQALADCSDIDQGGGRVKSFLSSSVDAEDAFTAVNGKAIETMYRYARKYGLTTQENLDRMRQGLAPIFPNGSVANLDHIIPVKYAPELKALPANLRILSEAENKGRQAAVDNHCRNKAKELMENIGWTPKKELNAELGL